MPIQIKRALIGSISFLVLLIILLMTVTIVSEGHVAVVKSWGKANYQIDPGLHFVVPIRDSVEHIEVRQRKNVEDLAAATNNQLPVTATVSINWTVDRDSAMDLFIQYGGLRQFETRILDPKLRSAAKAAISKFPADVLIRNRQAAVSAIMENMVESLAGFQVVVNSPQIENIVFPETYMTAVLQKEQAREAAEREKHSLEQQRLKALQAVNSAEANATAKRLEADAEAYRISTVADAEAESIRLIVEELRGNHLFVEYARVQRWNGVMPKTLLSDDVTALVPTGEAK